MASAQVGTGVGALDLALDPFFLNHPEVVVETEDRSALLTRLARLSAVDAHARHLADRLCEAARVILGAEGGWITVHDSSGQGLRLSSTDEVATALEDIQEVVGEGPCRDAFQTGAAMRFTVRSESSAQWPEFTRSAYKQVGAVVIGSYPMRPVGSTFGVLNFYARPDAGRVEPDEVAQLLADVVGAALLDEPGETPQDDGGGMWSFRDKINQATGMVTAQLGVSADDALALLRAHAFAHECTLNDMADQVVKRVITFDNQT